MNAGSTGLNSVNGLDGFGGAGNGSASSPTSIPGLSSEGDLAGDISSALASHAGGAGTDPKAIIIILPGKGESTDISDDSSCACDHQSAAPAPAPARGQKTPAPGFTPFAGAADVGQSTGGGNSGGVLQALVAVLGMLMLLLKKLLGLENSGSDSGSGRGDHAGSSTSAPASHGENEQPRVIVINR
jgi:hypothetical protein